MKAISLIITCLVYLSCLLGFSQKKVSLADNESRQRISINDGWRFFKYPSAPDSLIYDVRPEIKDQSENEVADARPTEAFKMEATQKVLKSWILQTGNDFIKDPEKRYIRPKGNPGADFPFVMADFDDNSWEKINVPHDWAINQPFYEGDNPEVGGGMGRLPVHGVAWYRRKLDVTATDAGKSIFLEIDGAMSYAMVWINVHLAGGWPYGYASWQVDLTPYLNFGGENQLAIRVDNPNHSARWYPGGGIYRNVWLNKVNPVHVKQWATYITSKDVSKGRATVDVVVRIENYSNKDATIEALTYIFVSDATGNKAGKVIASLQPVKLIVGAGKSSEIKGVAIIKNPRLWGPPPTQIPNLYVAQTVLLMNGKPIDTYETCFGIRFIQFDPDKGIIVNGERIPIRGVNQHHDLGALGAAFNVRAAQRQLEVLREMGCNAIRMSHNPPAPELLDLTDRMGFLVMDEIFDSWELKKTPLDFHLIFPDWHEQDARAFVRRDRNHPSIIMWSFGNEVGEQYTSEDGVRIAEQLRNIVKDEDPTRPTTSAMNYAKPDMPFPAVLDVISLNYQGEGIR